MKDPEIEVVSLCQVPHAGDECLIERAIVRLFGEHFVSRRVVDDDGPVDCAGYRQALPLHTRVEQPQDQIEGNCSPRVPPRHGSSAWFGDAGFERSHQVMLDTVTGDSILNVG
jgi:hypothetical protein